MRLGAASLAREDVPGRRCGSLMSGARPRFARLHHPRGVRSAPSFTLIPDRGRQGGDGRRAGAAPDRRYGRLQGAALGAGAIRIASAPGKRIVERQAACRKRVVFAEGEEGTGDPRRLFLRQSGAGLGVVLVGREDSRAPGRHPGGLRCSPKRGSRFTTRGLSPRNTVHAQFLYERLQRRGFPIRDCQRLDQSGSQLLRRSDGRARATPTRW